MLTFKQPIILAAILSASFSMAANYHGTVFIDSNRNGIFDPGEKPMKAVSVTDGKNVVRTDKDGRFSLPGCDYTRFIYISTPAGYIPFDNYYIPVNSGKTSYDFPVVGFEKTAPGKPHSFIQFSDSEIFNTELNDVWIEDVRRYTANEGVGFIVHTGDICYPNGLRDHIRLMNRENMGVPVYYCIGNHDLVKGNYGEEMFESIYGPAYYSFNAGGAHYVVTPMHRGDQAPSYDNDRIISWLRNDLENLEKGTPVYYFNHFTTFATDRFLLKGKTDSICLNDYNLKAWIYGHIHSNNKHAQGRGVYTMSSSTPDKGGIDHSTNSYRVVTVDPQGNSTVDTRYTYLHDHAVVASPIGLTSARNIAINAYSSVSPVKSVSCFCTFEGKTVGKPQQLTQATNWAWTGRLNIPENLYGKPLTFKASILFADGTRLERTTDFIYSPDAVSVEIDGDWTNLLGNSAHTGGNTNAPVDSMPALAWTTNVGGNIFMASPLIYNGRIFTATVDENDEGNAAIFALDAKTGEIAWKHSVAGSIKNTIAIAADKVFAQDAVGNLYAVNCGDGSLAWKAKLPIAWYIPMDEGLATKGDTVFAGSGKALSAFDAKSGELLWRNTAWQQGEGTTQTLSVADGVVVGGVQWTALFGNSASTGEMLWKERTDGLSNRAASPAMIGGLIYLPSSQSFFVLDASTGRIIAKKKLPMRVDVTSTPLILNDEIVFGSSNEGVVAIDPQSFELKWKCQTNNALVFTSPYTRMDASTVETSAVAAGNRIFVSASDGIIRGLERGTGKIRWYHAAGAPIFNSPAISGNALVVTDFGGNIYLFATPQ